MTPPDASTCIFSVLTKPVRSSSSLAAAILSRIPSSVGSYNPPTIAIAAFGALRAMYI